MKSLITIICVLFFSTQASANCCSQTISKRVDHGAPIKAISDQPESQFYYYYEDKFSHNIEAQGFKVKTAIKLRKSKRLLQIAMVNTLKQIEFAAETGHKYLYINLPYNSSVISQVKKRLTNKGFRILKGSFDAPNGYLVVTWSKCRVRSLAFWSRIFTSDIEAKQRGFRVSCSK